MSFCRSALHGALIVGIAFGAGTADAAKKKKPAKVAAEKVEAQVREAPKANAEAIAQLMGPFKWGMTKEEVLEALEKQIAARYEEDVKATNDMYERNRLRKQVKTEIKKVNESFIEFTGKQTGWDVSIIEREFGHKTNESMFVYQEYDVKTKRDQQRFFFFYENKLWKMFIAFNMDMFKDKTFNDFAQVMRARFGEFAIQDKPDKTGIDFLYWRSKDVYLRAIDLTKFYGNFCLGISDASKEKEIAELRLERNPPDDGKSMIDNIIIDEKAKPKLDDNADAVERLIKKGD